MRLNTYIRWLWVILMATLLNSLCAQQELSQPLENVKKEYEKIKNDSTTQGEKNRTSNNNA